MSDYSWLREPRKRKDHSNNNDLAEKFREFRVKSGLTQDKLADKANVGLAQVRKLEQGNHNVSFSTIKDVCKILNVDIVLLELEAGD